MTHQEVISEFPWKRRHVLAALPIFFLGAILAAGLTASPYSAAEVQEVLRRAQSARLHEHPYWLTLLHWDGRESRVDDPAFFLAPNGKRDAGAELQAELAAFLAARQSDEDKAADRFPARLEWLCEALHIDRARLPVPECAEVESALRSLEPRSAVVAFPAAYMGTPASTFGHTLITIRGKRRSELMNQTVNYAASIPPNANQIAFIYRGIFGGYPGYYSLMPYYKKVQEYSGMEQRDIWEYELTLTPPEIRRMLLHVWEVRNIYSDYFFFGENCSFNLLYLLDAARPGLNLAGRFQGIRFWVVPLDTVKVMRDAGLLVKVVYRPSLSTQVRTHAAALSPAQAELARQVGVGETPPAEVANNPGIPKATAGRILDLGAEYLQSRRGRKKIDQAAFQSRYFSILAERSKLPAAEENEGNAEWQRVNDEWTAAGAAASSGLVPPDEGHGSGRLTLGMGTSQGRRYSEIGCRTAYHDLMDSDPGFDFGSEVQFMSLAVRWYVQPERLTLEHFDVIRLRSLSGRDRFYQPISWELGTGVRRDRSGSDGREVHSFYLDGGPGLSWKWKPGGGGLFYAMLDGDLRLGDLDEDWAFGAGPKSGLLVRVTPRWQVHAYAQWTSFIAGAEADNWEGGLQQRFTLSRNTAIVLDFAHRRTWEFTATEASLTFLLYL